MEAIGWHWLDIIELVMAVLVGFAVGLEREVHDKPAGITTIGLVTLAGTLMCQLSIKLPSMNGDGVGDPTRLAAAVITGIGFLGAGTILRQGQHVEGVTTAATIWVMSAVGIGIGAGYYIPSLATAVLVLLGFWSKRWTNPLADWIRMKRGMPPRNE